jgi:hypothetical protein
MTIFKKPFAKGNSQNHQFYDKMSFILSLLFERLHYYYVYFHYSYVYNYTPTCITIIISLGPCALNAEFQHFILRFNKISLKCQENVVK